MLSVSFIPQILIEHLLFENYCVRNGETISRGIQNTPAFRIVQLRSSNYIQNMVKYSLRFKGVKEARGQIWDWEKWEGEGVWLKTIECKFPGE